MQITTGNYFEHVAKVGIENMPPGVKNMHSLIDQLTKGGQDWSIYLAQKSKFDKQFEAIELLYKEKDKKTVAPKAEQEPIKPEKKSKVERLKPATESQPVKRERTEIRKPVPCSSGVTPSPKPKKYKLPEVNVRGKRVPTIHPEIALIKRYALLHGKTK